MTSSKWLTLGTIQLWMSGAIFGLGIGMVISGFLLGLMLTALSPMLAVLGSNNLRRAARSSEPVRGREPHS